MGNTYTLDITGDKVQNVGLRKKYHELLDKNNINGIAINDPYKNNVKAFISGSKIKRDKTYSELSEYISNKTGSGIQIKENTVAHGLKSVSVSPDQLKDTSSSLYLAFMMRNPGADTTKQRGLGLRKAEQDLMPRFRLKKKNKKYTAKLTEMGRDQILNRAPHYEKFRKKNLAVAEEDAMLRMHPADRNVIKKLLAKNKNVIHS